MLHVNMSCPSVLHDRNPCNLNVLTIDGTVLTYKTFARVVNKITSLLYFGVKLSCVCPMFAYRKKLPIVTLR